MKTRIFDKLLDIAGAFIEFVLRGENLTFIFFLVALINLKLYLLYKEPEVLGNLISFLLFSAISFLNFIKSMFDDLRDQVANLEKK